MNFNLGLKQLHTAESLGLSKRPCDICKKKDRRVHFFGNTNVLVCGRDNCISEIQRRREELMKSYEEEGKHIEYDYDE